MTWFSHMRNNLSLVAFSLQKYIASPPCRSSSMEDFTLQRLMEDLREQLCKTQQAVDKLEDYLKATGGNRGKDSSLAAFLKQPGPFPGSSQLQRDEEARKQAERVYEESCNARWRPY